MTVNIFIQARMSSSRFPGKVLAPLHNIPLIKHIIDRAKKVKGAHDVIVLTSMEESDDPLVAYLEKIQCKYFRGSLTNVFSRFEAALNEFPCDYFVRLSADSPLIDNRLVDHMISQSDTHDVISNVVIRSFPKGQSVEIAKSGSFVNVDITQLSDYECEHVFPYFYKNKNKFKIRSIENVTDESSLNLCVDTLQDLTYLSSTSASYQFKQTIYVE